MATTLISIGPTLNILQSVVYAIPATPVRIVTGSIVQYSNLIGGPFADIANNSQIKAGFIQCVVGNTTVTLTKVKMKKSVLYNQAISDGAIAFWKLDETSGLVAKDSAGSAHGTISGGVILGQTGPNGNAMSFDGVDDFIGIPFSVVPKVGSNSVTWECWIKTNLSQGFKHLVDFGQDGAIAPGFSFMTGGAGQIHLSISDGVTLYQPGLAVPYFDGQFHQVVGVIRRAPDNLADFYFDGILKQSTPMTLVGSLSTTSPGSIGSYSGGGGGWFQGIIDNVAIYNKALTPTQILEHYKAGV